MKRGAWRAGKVPAAAAAIAATVLGAASAAAQQPAHVGFPHGTPVVVLPVQSTEPLPGGSWPGALPSEEETLRSFDAEMAFALQDRRSAEGWAMPQDVVRRARRNPLLRVDPTQVAYHALLRPLDERDQIPEPLHGEMRTLAALFDTRFVILPMRLTEARADSTASSDGGLHVASLQLALVDIRSSRVLWQGVIEGDPAPAGSPLLLATLAARVAAEVAPS